ncbi:MAG: hypothetical protein ACLFTQ_03755 [Candidatus Aenigmatarchaeota archaeon]
MRIVLLRAVVGILAGFLGGLVSYFVYRRYDEAHKLMYRLLYRPLKLPEETKRFKRRFYLLLMSVLGLIYGLVFEIFRMSEILGKVGLDAMQSLYFFAFSIIVSLLLFEGLLRWKVPDPSKEIMKQWLYIGLSFGFFLALFFNLGSLLVGILFFL